MTSILNQNYQTLLKINEKENLILLIANVMLPLINYMIRKNKIIIDPLMTTTKKELIIKLINIM